MIIEAVLSELADSKEASLRRLVAYDPDTNPLVGLAQMPIPLSAGH